jgi:hypothetical protein
MPGQRASSVTSSVTSSQQQQHRPHKKQCRQKPHPAVLQYQQLPCQHEPLDSDLSTHLTSSCVSASTSVDCWEGAEEAAAVVVSSRKRSRLVACSVVEVGACWEGQPDCTAQHRSSAHQAPLHPHPVADMQCSRSCCGGQRRWHAVLVFSALC